MTYLQNKFGDESKKRCCYSSVIRSLLLRKFVCTKTLIKRRQNNQRKDYGWASAFAYISSASSHDSSSPFSTQWYWQLDEPTLHAPSPTLHEQGGCSPSHSVLAFCQSSAMTIISSTLFIFVNQLAVRSDNVNYRAKYSVN
ncbi:hypothetical protein PPYR_11107 [Photinus pyralis]|uniref:Uncharacterized protein n=1 Tax=Photinus pyralis TaxID=7054 RepID=A0A5N4AIE3_PHOPY|nr:hypothetical protein PPYR_11107 [Photinus pyralis]